MVVQKQVKFDKRSPYYHRKVARSGGSRYLSVGRILPADWLIVRVSVVKLEGRACTLEITKLD